MAEAPKKKSGQKGIYARERDAKAAALKKYKEGEFEIVSGSKGFVIREVKKYTPVANAKLHGPHGDATGDAEPEEIQQENGESLPATLTTRAHDTSAKVDSNERLAEEAETAPKTTTILVVESATEKVAIEAKVIEEHPAIPHRAECPNCHQMIETFGIKGARFFIEHEVTTEDGIEAYCDQSEESIPPVKPMPTNGFKPHELAQIRHAAEQNAAEAVKAAASNDRGEQVRPLTSHLKKSLIPSPSKTVWDIAEKLLIAHPEWTRKEILAHCESLGIATNTARTQYQQWRTAMRESAINAAKANKPPDAEA